MPRSNVLLFRASHQKDAFEKVFEEKKWTVRSISVLSFSRQNDDKFTTCLKAASSYSGIIVTSPRAGDILAERLSKDAALRNEWQQRTVLCIGKRSAAHLIQCGLSPHIAARADGRSVAESIISLGAAKPWLFICGNLRRDELPTRLTAANVPFEEVQVYYTQPHEHIPLDDVERPEWVVFFSPSGVQTVKENWPASWKGVKKAAIGSTTAASIKQAGWKVDAVAAKPEADALYKAITSSLMLEDS